MQNQSVKAAITRIILMEIVNVCAGTRRLGNCSTRSRKEGKRPGDSSATL